MLAILYIWAVLAQGAPAPPRVLFFVASDCPISNGYAPEIQRLCAEYGRRGVRCSLVYEDVALDPAAMRQHLDEYGYRDMPAAIDSDRTMARRAGASITPEAVLVDAKGNTRYRGRIDNRYAEIGKPRRVVTVHDLRDALEAVLAGKPVAHPETTALGCHIATTPKHLP
jgi:thiol-disulfide isomerase/thioredoxin